MVSLSNIFHLALEKETSLDLFGYFRRKIRGDGQFSPFLVRIPSGDIILGCKCKRVASQQQSERRLFVTGNADDRGGSLRRISRLLAVVVVLESNGRADRGIVFRPPFTKSGGGTGEVGAEAAGLDNRDFDAERPEFLGENFGETFDTPLCRRIGAATGRSDSSADRADLNNVAGPLLAKCWDRCLGQVDHPKK